MRGAANVSLSIKSISSVEINLPPIETQISINKLVDDFKIRQDIFQTELKTQSNLLSKLRQSYLQEAVMGKLTEPSQDDAKTLLADIKSQKAQLIKEGKLRKEKPLPPIKPEEIPFEIPDNWVWCRLGEICEEIIDCPHSTPKYTDTESDYFGIDTNCINEKGEITRLRGLSKESYEERIKRIVPRENDIVYSREGSIGLAAFIPPNINICLGQRVMLFRPSEIISPKYLKFVITEENYKNRLLAKHRGMGAKHVNVGDIINSLIPLPPLSEQKAIVAKVEDLLGNISLLESENKTQQIDVQRLMGAVLQEAFGG
ncbi:MAG: restriction endonuclease subunit S [Arcicella sp.]|nr:restriction endonuclease subunit S [Arcicella sp.]